MIKILYLCRLFDGLETSIKNKKWIPSGVPTIYKIIEGIDKSNFKAKLLLTDFGSGKNLKTKTSFRSIKILRINGLTTKVQVIPGETIIPLIFGKKLRLILTGIYRQLVIISETLRSRPDVVYIDKANLVAATILSRFFFKKVILRIMGIYPDMWQIKKEKRFVLMRWMYKSNFSHVICTEDGSGGKQWMNFMLRKTVSRTILLNGINKESFSSSSFILKKSKKVKILFMGRMEKIKGIEEFIRSIFYLKEEVKRKIDIYIVGTGSLNDKVDYLIKSFYLSNLITRIKIIKHDEIKSFIKQFDIYVSLNKAGNISNANIECFYSGLCCIIPNKDEKIFRDIDLEKYFPNDCLLRLKNEKLVEDLTDKISKLVLNRKIIKKYSKNLKKKSLKIFKDWDFRINKELDLIKKIASH